VPDFTFRLLQQGKFLRIPLAFGDTTNEGTVFTPTSIDSIDQMDNFLEDNFPQLTSDMTSTINEFYPESTQFAGHGAFFSAAANAYGEMRYTCTGNFISATVAKFRSPLPNWNYHYNVIDPAQAAQGLGVPHTAELTAVWGPQNVVDGGGTVPASYLPNGTNAAIIPVVQGYWTSFIRSFDPNTHRASGSPIWAPFSSVAGGARILFETNATRMEAIPSDQEARCGLLSTIAVALQQ